MITEDTASEFYCPEAVAGKTGQSFKGRKYAGDLWGKGWNTGWVSVILKGSPTYFLDRQGPFTVRLRPLSECGDLAENETRYVTGEEAVDIGGTSDNPADLMVEEGKVVTLPEEASFGDAELSLEALPEGGAMPVNAGPPPVRL